MARLIMAYTISPAATNAGHPLTQILPTFGHRNLLLQLVRLSLFGFLGAKTSW